MEELITLLESSKDAYYLSYFSLTHEHPMGWIHNKLHLYRNWKPVIESFRDAWLKTKMER
jgi:hypothetical protein